MNDKDSPKIIAFCCSNCASSAAGIVHKMNDTLPENVKIIQVPCTGRIEVLHLLKPFENGAAGVCVAGCQEDSCQYINGIQKAKKRVAHVKKILSDLDIEPDRIEAFSLSAARGWEFIQIMRNMIDKVKPLDAL